MWRGRWRRRLWGVRLDTPEHMVDKSVLSQHGNVPPTGRERAARLERAERPRRARDSAT